MNHKSSCDNFSREVMPFGESHLKMIRARNEICSSKRAHCGGVKKRGSLKVSSFDSVSVFHPLELAFDALLKISSSITQRFGTLLARKMAIDGHHLSNTKLVWKAFQYKKLLYHLNSWPLFKISVSKISGMNRIMPAQGSQFILHVKI